MQVCVHSNPSLKLTDRPFMIKSLTICSCFFFIFLPSASFQQQSTQVISGKGVFIFGPSLAEADSLNSEEAEALNIFAHYSSNIASFVRAESIKCEYVSARQIEVQYASVKVFIVNRDSIQYGTILTDGDQKPVLLKYVTTETELEENCKEYFHIK
jgi:hypothetical protein